jgi:hypothetical protein
LSKTKEFGVDNNTTGVAATKGEVAEDLVTETRVGVQVAVVVLQLVVVT